MIAAAALLLALQAPPEKKVLLIFIDGFVPDAIATTKTPALQALSKHAAWSMEARAESTTISGSGWSTFLTGVHWDKHGVPDNAFEKPNYKEYPSIIALLKEARPKAKTTVAQCWKPIEDELIELHPPDFRIFHDYDAYSTDYWDAESCDTKCAEDLVPVLRDEDVDLAVIMFGELDGVGHSEENSHYDAGDPLYQKMLAKTDAHIGALLAAIQARPTFAREDWLVIMSTDHAGSKGRGHGQNIPAHRRIPLLVSGPSVVPGEIWPPPKAADIVPTALHHLGVEIREEWDLDGRVIGFEAMTRPEPQLGANLIFNGDAEYERGYTSYVGQPDASVPGWDDPGAMTVIAYGAGNGFPRKGSGRSFFAGGGVAADAFMTQEIDVSSLAEAIDDGVEIELSGMLGGYADQEDRAELRAVFLDAAGEELGVLSLVGGTAKTRRGRTGFEAVSAGAEVPLGTRRIRVRLDALHAEGHNDGYADDLVLVLGKR